MSEIQRAHRRYSLASVDAVVAGVVCPVINVSVSGILIEGAIVLFIFSIIFSRP